MTWFVDEEKAVNIVYLDLTKAFDAVSPSILLEELSAPGLHRCIVSENCVDGWAKKVMELNPVGSQSPVVFPRAQYLD